MFPEQEQAFLAYKQYLALKQHFTAESYDYFKYNGVVRATESSFMKRKDKPMFFRLSRHPDIQGLIVANFVDHKYPSKVWVADIVSEEGKRIYERWLDRQKRLPEVLDRDYALLRDDFRSNFIAEGGSCHLIRLLLQRAISPESAALLIAASGATKLLDEQLEANLRWPDLRSLLRKYLPFIKATNADVARALKTRWPSVVGR